MTLPPRLVAPRLLVVVTAALALSPLLCAAWYRGNTHAHTRNSDGDAPPEAVVQWFRDHGYQFVVLSDHDFLTDVAPLNEQFGTAGKFLVIRGEEITQMLADPQHSAAHINGINVDRLIEPIGTPRKPAGRTAPASVTAAETFRRNIAAIREAGGIPQVNHPFFKWSLRPKDLFDLPPRTLLEIWNGYPASNNLGGVDDQGDRCPSTEELWDTLLSRGQVIWGVGSDDSHNYYQFDQPSRALPGRAWVMVRADALTAAAITAALARGDFYASTGVTLADYAASAVEIKLTLTVNEKGPQRFTTTFIGQGGRTLAVATGSMPVYHPHGDEGYVRAVVTDSNGLHAWTQPVFLDRRRSAAEK